VSEGLQPRQFAAWLERARADLTRAGIRGRDTTPFLLARIAELSEGRSVEVNLRLLEENARLAAAIARAGVHPSGDPFLHGSVA
jgi:pseudouridine-5'-phosphate glycosidase